MGELSPLLHNLFSPQLFLALVVSLALIPFLRRVAVKINLVDHPGGRKQHKDPVPLVGGAAIFISLLVSSYIWKLPNGFEGFSVAICGLFLIGFLDDKYDISAKFRLIIQTGLVVFALWLDNNWLHQIAFTEEYALQLNEFKYPFTVVLILGLINAINMLDGLDGLSSGIVLIILGFLIGISSLAGTAEVSLVATSIFGAVLGFWAFNYRFSWREKASIFMGDSGTIVLGFALPYLAIKLTLIAPTYAPESMMLWLFALPVWDICAVVMKRLRDGKSPLQAGRDHIHHVLMAAGLTVRHTLHLIYLLTISTISFGVAIQYFSLSKIEGYLAFLTFMAFYLGRVGSLYRKSRAEVYDFKSLGDRRKQSYIEEEENVVPLTKRSKTLS